MTMCLSLCASLGCSAVVSPDPNRLAGGADADALGLDAALPSTDAFVPSGSDAIVSPQPDAYVPPGVDASAPPDAWTPRIDAGPPPTCMEGLSRCEGGVLVVCRGGVESRTDCSEMGAYCDSGRCRPWACEPGSVRCSRDGSGVVQCDDRGASTRYVRCETGCDPVTASCRGATTGCGTLPAIELGSSERFDLCAGTGATTFTRAEGCGASSMASSPDRTFALTLAERTTIEVDLRDVDPSVGIDTVVYLRRACDDAASQIACSDDVPCEESDISMGCSGGVQVRQSRFTVTLEAGTYYVVADAFRYDSFGCGVVELRVSTP